MKKSKLVWHRRRGVGASTLKGIDALPESKKQGASRHVTSSHTKIDSANIQKPSQLVAAKHTELPFDGQYLKMLGKPAEGFKLMISAAPGAGKTYWANGSTLWIWNYKGKFHI